MEPVWSGTGDRPRPLFDVTEYVVDAPVENVNSLATDVAVVDNLVDVACVKIHIACAGLELVRLTPKSDAWRKAAKERYEAILDVALRDGVFVYRYCASTRPVRARLHSAFKHATVVIETYLLYDTDGFVLKEPTLDVVHHMLAEYEDILANDEAFPFVHAFDAETVRAYVAERESGLAVAILKSNDNMFALINDWSALEGIMREQQGRYGGVFEHVNPIAMWNRHDSNATTRASRETRNYYWGIFPIHAYWPGEHDYWDTLNLALRNTHGSKERRNVFDAFRAAWRRDEALLLRLAAIVRATHRAAPLAQARAWLNWFGGDVSRPLS